MTGAASLILKGGAEKTKPCSLRSLRFFICLPFQASLKGLQIKNLRLSPKAFLFRREDRIRTCDPLVPNQVRYRPALLPETITSFLMGSKGNE